MSWLSSLFSSSEQTVSKDATIYDALTYVASLVSNPNEIDPMLDKMREISARLDIGQTPTAADRAELTEVYNNIEKYLVEQEPIRKFSKEEIRQRVRTKFPDIAPELIKK